MNRLLLTLSLLAASLLAQNPNVRAAQCASATGNDTYVCTTDPATASWVTGTYFLLVPGTANTGACSLDAGPGAKNIKKMVAGVATDPANNEIQANMPTLLYYDGTNLVMITGVGGSSGSSGITSLGTTGNPQTGTSQILAVGTTGSDFNIVSATDTHTFHLPDAGASARGAVTTGTQTFAGAKTFSGAVTGSVNGAASTPAYLFSGTIFTGGTATSTKPHLLIEPSGTTSTNWSTAGTLYGANAASGYTGNLLDLQLNNTSKFKVTSVGTLTINDGGIATTLTSTTLSSSFAPLILHSTSTGSTAGHSVRSARSSNMTYTSGDGGSHITLSTFAPTSGTGTFSSLLLSDTLNQTSTATGITRGLYVSPTFTRLYNWRHIETNAATIPLLSGTPDQTSVLFGIPTYTAASGITTTNASTVEISGAPVAGTNVTITNARALNVAGGVARFAGNILLVPVAVNSLPTCNAAAEGMIAAVNDAAATPVYNATVANGGSVKIPVYCNGTNWTNH